MALDQQKASPGKQIALLIDADNISHSKIPDIIAELSQYGTANIRRAYGDWANPQMQKWKDRLHEFAIRPIQQFNYSAGKNATDIALVIDAMELLYTQKLDAFCIASSDGDFTPLVMQLKANGHEVYGFGEQKTPSPFVNACTNFLYLENLTSASGQTATAPNSNKSAADDAIAKDDKILSQDTKLVTALRGAVEVSVREDGWANMSAAGSAVKRQGPFDPRNYGCKNFTQLFEKTGLFEVQKSPNGQTYVADKRNKDRSKEPNQ